MLHRSVGSAGPAARRGGVLATETEFLLHPRAVRAARRKLLGWYRSNRRDLPWRRTRDPYRIWVSEVMLQQTQVATVLPYYRRFVKRFPTAQRLAAAPLEEILAAWSGLGYYRRARNLHAAAREVVDKHGGKIPADYEAFRGLPGVGDYTAGAVASIAFGRPEPALDGNTLRVLCRLLARRGDPRTQPVNRELRAAARRLLDEGPPGELNQALMELGALVCLPSSPRCPDCPLRAECRALESGLQSVLPERRRTRPQVELGATVAVIRKGVSFLMVRREGRGLMDGLWELPGATLRDGEDPREGITRVGRERLGRPLRAGKRLASFRQTITYRRLSVEAYEAVLSEPTPGGWMPGGSMRWVRPEELRDLPHGAATRRLLAELGRRSPTRSGRPRSAGRAAS